MKPFTVLSLVAGLYAAAASMPAQVAFSPRDDAATFHASASFSHAGRAGVHEGSRDLGEIDRTYGRASIATEMPLRARSALLAGFAAQWLEFHPAAGSPVPERLSSVALKLGVTHSLDSTWSLRVEAEPGLYGDSVGSGGSFGAPIAAGVIRATSRELQWVFGALLDWRSGHPVVGTLGVRWQFSPDWTLALLLPEPRIEWAATSTCTFFAGASVQGGTFRVARDFGRKRGRAELDRQFVDYRELTAGVGARWQVSSTATLQVVVGQMLDRRFEFHDRNLLLNGDGAPTAQITLASRF